MRNPFVEEAVRLAGGQTSLANATGSRQQEVWLWLNGRRVPMARAPRIERAVGGKVTVEELCPDVCWVRVPDADWPHPAGRPCIDVADRAASAAANTDRADAA